MPSRTSVAVALVVSGLLVVAPITATAAFADDTTPTSPNSSTAPTGTTPPGTTSPDPTPSAAVSAPSTDPSTDPATPDPSSSETAAPSDPSTPTLIQPLVLPIIPIVPIIPPTPIIPADPGDPTDVTAVNTDAGTGWHITWGAAANTDQYEVFVSDLDDDSQTIVDDYTDGTSYDVDGLVDGDSYSVQIFSYHDGTDGSGYAELEQTFVSTAGPVTTAPSEVQNLTASKSDATTIEVDWDAPADSGSSDIMGYDVDVYDYSGIQILSAARSLAAHPGRLAGHTHVDASAFPGYVFVTLDKAYANTELQVVVTATNGDGLTSTTDTSIAFGNPSPAAPQNTNAVVSGHHDVSTVVTWEPPVDNGSDPITSYVVYYTFDGQQSSHESDNLPATARSYTITGLSPGVLYGFHVVAFAGDEIGAASTVNMPAAAPTPAIPAAPDFASLTGYPVTNGTVQLPASFAGQWVFGVAYSTPSALGWSQVAADGTVHFDLSAAKLGAGDHHILVIDNDGVVRGAAAFTVGSTTATTTAALASTGTDDSGLVGLAGLLLAFGLVLIVGRRVVRAIR